MEFEVLKKSRLKRNILIGVTTIAVLTAGILTFTKAKYRVTESIPLVNGAINYELSDLNLIGVYFQGDNGYTKSDTIPESGYVLNEEESYCTVNGEEDPSISINYDTNTKTLNVSPMTTKGTKCYLYFDEKPITNFQELIASKTLATRTDFSTTVTEDTTGTIYYADTSKGRTYYFAGNPTDNWVYFGGFYWRIIRINEDGTIRIIYQGTSANTTGTGTRIGKSTFNGGMSDNAYVGYMYTIGSLRGYGNDSGIKGSLDTWYQNNLASYTDMIDGNAGFCGDRQPSTDRYSSNDSGGTGTTVTYYGAFIRLVSSKNPTFECENESDLYTTSGSEDGNGALTYPIGLITADEVAYAGGVFNVENQSYYLHTEQYYWTMTPANFGGSHGNVFGVSLNGILSNMYGSGGERPVINLKADVTIQSGTGTSTDPYVIASYSSVKALENK